MSLSKGVGSAIAGIAGIVVVVIAVILIVNVLAGEPPVTEIIEKSVELRNAESAVERADLITEVDDLVVEASAEEVREQWERVLQCLPKGCPDEAFLDMALVTAAAYEEDLQNSALLINVIATAKYWGESERMLEFSKALSTADDQVEALDDRDVEKAWEDVVECAGQCPERYDLYFGVIQAIVR